jgi:hypothetical protein
MSNTQILRHVTVAGVIILSICVAGSVSFAAPKPKMAAKQKIPATIIVENKRSSDLTNFSIYESGNEDKAVSSLKKPLASNKKLILSLKGLKTCNVTLSGTFADESDASGEIDVCAEKIIRLVD